MKILGTIVLVLCVFSLPFTGAAADFDGSKPLECVYSDLIECDLGADCRRVTAESINAPKMLSVDFKQKKITQTQQSQGGRTSLIEHMKHVDGKLILQSAEEGYEGVKDGLGWSLAISEETGQMVLTASGDEVGFVIFGICTTK